MRTFTVEALEKGKVQYYTAKVLDRIRRGVLRCYGCKTEFPFDMFSTSYRFLDKKNRLCRPCVQEGKRNGAAPFGNAKALARNGKKDWELSKEQYMQLVCQLCSYCKRPLGKTGIRLDRIDNARGYEITNVLPCCYLCNRIRSDYFSVEEMRVLVGPTVQRVHELRGERS